MPVRILRVPRACRRNRPRRPQAKRLTEARNLRVAWIRSERTVQRTLQTSSQNLEICVRPIMRTLPLRAAQNRQGGWGCVRHGPCFPGSGVVWA
jgi:hypothetical protein